MPATWIVFAAVLSAATPPVAVAEPAEQPAPAVAHLPEPLQEVACGITDLEQTGYFTVTKVEQGRTPVHNEEAILWTIGIQKPLTYRHALLLLRRFRDVRFYDTAKGSRQELHRALLYYSERLSIGAVNRELLKEDDTFQVWISIDSVTIRRLTSLGADTVEFREFRHTLSGSD